jgi:hypothetical protein
MFTRPALPLASSTRDSRSILTIMFVRDSCSKQLDSDRLAADVPEEGGGVRSGPGEARTILLLHIISDRPSKQPLMVGTFLKVYVELGSYFVSARTNKRHHHHH